MKAIILIHEFWGVNNQMKKVGARIEAEGFKVKYADLYEGKLAQNVDEARKMKEEVRDERALEILNKCVSEFEAEGIAKNEIAIWGFCMGGSFSYLAAISGLKIGGYIIYYGSRISDDKDLLANINSPVLGVFGGLDKAIPRERVEGFRDALAALSKTSAVYIYDDADHAFFNDERPSYNEKAALDAWEKTLAFLRRN